MGQYLKAMSKNIGPMDTHKRVAASIEEFNNPFGEPQETRADWAKRFKIPEKGEVVYFTGCTAAYRTQDLARNVVKIMKKAGIDFTILGTEEMCCGSNLLRTGQTDYVETLVKGNIKAIKKRGAKTLVASCSGCFKTFKLDYPRIAGEMDLEVMHISQFLVRLVDEGRLKLKELNETVTYHDPCHMGRHVGVYDEPRRVLQEMGVKIKEMDFIKEDSKCCGAGGGVKACFPDLAAGIAEKRVREAAATGAKTLVSCCPFCKFNLADAANLTKEPIKVKDLTTLVIEAMEP